MSTPYLLIETKEENKRLSKELAEMQRLVAENASLRRQLEPKHPPFGGTCQGIWEGSTCERSPDFELFVPSLSPKPYVLCKAHTMAAQTTFHSLGIFYKSYEHDYKGKQQEMFGGLKC